METTNDVLRSPSLEGSFVPSDPEPSSVATSALTTSSSMTSSTSSVLGELTPTSKDSDQSPNRSTRKRPRQENNKRWLHNMLECYERKKKEKKVILDVEPMIVDTVIMEEEAPGVKKLYVNHPEYALTRPYRRPTESLPIETNRLKSASALRITLTTDHSDFEITRKLSGNIDFIPPTHWPAETAKVCIFYFIGTQNIVLWSYSKSVIVPVKRCENNTVKFVISPARNDKRLTNNKPNPMIKLEQIVVVAVVRADGISYRSDEATFSYAESELLKMEGTISQLTDKYRQLIAEKKEKNEKEIICID